MQLNFDDMYQLESGASYKKIYRFKKKNQDKILLDFSYNHTDYVSFLEVNNFLSNINISVPKIFDTDDSKSIIMMEDFGVSRYDKLINSINTKEILTYAIHSLIEIKKTQIPIVNNIIKPYNFSSFETEIAEFTDFYLTINNISPDIVEEFFYIWRQEYVRQN